MSLNNDTRERARLKDLGFSEDYIDEFLDYEVRLNDEKSKPKPVERSLDVDTTMGKNPARDTLIENEKEWKIPDLQNLQSVEYLDEFFNYEEKLPVPLNDEESLPKPVERSLDVDTTMGTKPKQDTLFQNEKEWKIPDLQSVEYLDEFFNYEEKLPVPLNDEESMPKPVERSLGEGIAMGTKPEQDTLFQNEKEWKIPDLESEDYLDEFFNYEEKLPVALNDEESLPKPVERSLDEGIAIGKKPKQDTLFENEKEWLLPDLERKDYLDEFFNYEEKLPVPLNDEESLPKTVERSLNVDTTMDKKPEQDIVIKNEKEYLHSFPQDAILVDGVVTLQKASKFVDDVVTLQNVSKLAIDEKERAVVLPKQPDLQDVSLEDDEVSVWESSNLVMDEKEREVVLSKRDFQDDSLVDGEVLMQETSKFVVDEKAEEIILPKKEKSTRSRIVKILSNLLFYLGIIIALLSLFIYSDSSSTDKEILGYHFYNVLTTSMQSEIPQGSFVFVKTVDTDTIEMGDDITFYRDETTSVTHRVVGITENYNGTGARGFTTWGVDNPSADADIVYAANVVGVVQMHIPYLGLALKFVSNNLLLIFVMVGLVILLSYLLRTFFTTEKKPIETEEPPIKEIAE